MGNFRLEQTGTEIQNILNGYEELKNEVEKLELLQTNNSLPIETINEKIDVDNDLIGKGNKVFFINSSCIETGSVELKSLSSSTYIVIVQLGSGAQWSQYLFATLNQKMLFIVEWQLKEIFKK